MEWRNDNPTFVGKYIVKTRTLMGNIHKLEAYWNGKSWNVSNQIEIEYLKEI